MATNIIQVGPLPAGTSVQDVRNAFSAYALEKVEVSNDKAYLQFNDANEIQTLEFAFDSLKVPALNDAEIDTVGADFQWPEPAPEPVFILDEKKQVEAVKEKEVEVEEKYPDLDEKPKGGAKFIVVKECDYSHLKECDEQYIRAKVFGKYKIGRVVKWSQDVFIEFLDENQIQILENDFKDLFVLDLGPLAKIDAVDENFDINLVQQAVEKHKRQQKAKKEEEERLRLEEIEKNKRQMQEIKKKHDEQEKLSKMRETQARSRLSEKESEEKVDWRVRPDEKARKSQDSKPISFLWLGIVIAWGVYVILS